MPPPLFPYLSGQIIIRGEIIHKGQRQPAKPVGVLPVTACPIEGIMAPYKLDPVRRGLALVGHERVDFLLPDSADINVPLGVKGPTTPQRAIRITRPDLG